MKQKSLLILIICLFGLSQSAGLIVALQSQGKSAVVQTMDCEEEERFEKHENPTDAALNDFPPAAGPCCPAVSASKALCRKGYPLLKGISTPDTPPPDRA